MFKVSKYKKLFLLLVFAFCTNTIYAQPKPSAFQSEKDLSDKKDNILFQSEKLSKFSATALLKQDLIKNYVNLLNKDHEMVAGNEIVFLTCLYGMPLNFAKVQDLLAGCVSKALLDCKTSPLRLNSDQLDSKNINITLIAPNFVLAPEDSSLRAISNDLVFINLDNNKIKYLTFDEKNFSFHLFQEDEFDASQLTTPAL